MWIEMIKENWWTKSWGYVSIKICRALIAVQMIFKNKKIVKNEYFATYLRDSFKNTHTHALRCHV